MITKIVKLFTKKKPTFFEKAKSTASSYSATAKAKGMDAVGKMQKSKIYTDASKSVKEMSSKVSKSYNKLPENYKTGIKVSAGLGGLGAVVAGSMALSPKLKKNDPRYKALKKHGYV
jgi:homoserine kinase